MRIGSFASSSGNLVIDFREGTVAIGIFGSHLSIQRVVKHCLKLFASHVGIGVEQLKSAHLHVSLLFNCARRITLH